MKRLGFSIVMLAPLLVVVIGLLAAAGCGQRKDGNGAAVGEVSDQRLEEIRAEVRRDDPQAQVGRVLDVYENIAAVGDVDVSHLREGQVIVFTDARLDTLVSGRIVRILEDTVHVEFDKPQSGRRAPRAGDLAMRTSGS